MENWKVPQRILVVLAHPDDPEFFCGATLARWAEEGHHISYCLLTHGEKGSSDPLMQPETLAKLREGEQQRAAAVLGVKSVCFLNYIDGCLVPDMEARRTITRVIREQKPDILLTCDPSNYYIEGVRINHPDHRAAGQIVLDAFFPAVGNPHYFADLLQEGILPHNVQELWLSLPLTPNVVLDVTRHWPIKVQALYEHKSQIGDRDKFHERMMTRHTADSTLEHPRFEEKFRRLILT